MKRLLMLLVFSLLVACTPQTNTPSNLNYGDFAKCLSEKGASMYGASWCTHCKRQKEIFGDSFKYIDYIECDIGQGQLPVCTNMGIRGYPTWKFRSGEMIEGEASVVDLSKKSGCSLDLIK